AELAYEAAVRFPGLLPTLAEIDAERSHPQKDKRGLEIRQGEFFAHVLADSTRGHQLIGAMGRPLRQSIERLRDFQQSGYAELGCVSKMYRGLSPEDPSVGDLEEGRIEKPFLAAVEAWAIGGACQWLLVMDLVVAERNSYFSLPARNEGIIPGCAPLRLPRFI